MSFNGQPFADELERINWFECSLVEGDRCHALWTRNRIRYDAPALIVSVQKTSFVVKVSFIDEVIMIPKVNNKGWSRTNRVKEPDYESVDVGNL